MKYIYFLSYVYLIDTSSNEKFRDCQYTTTSEIKTLERIRQIADNIAEDYDYKNVTILCFSLLRTEEE